FVACEGLEDQAVRDAVKRSFFADSVKYTGFKPDWGVFTGIRPAREFGRMNLSVEEFAKVFEMSRHKAQLCADIVRVRNSISVPTGFDDISLYISIPFCPTRCTYCSFISGAGEKMLGLVPEYLLALRREILAIAELVGRLGVRVRTVYIGGGTPATLSAEQLDGLCRLVTDCFGGDLMEFTVELGRPDVITEEKLAAAREGGADRICINPQTLNDSILAAIGRRHTTEQFVRAMQMANRFNFHAINCDLIAGLPNDTAEGFARSLEGVLALGAQNVTVHSLCIKQGSDLKHNGADIVRSRAASQMVNGAITRLTECGYEPYYLYKQKHAVAALENTGWAKAGTASLYNMIMMDDLGSVIGTGAGSSTKILGNGSPQRVYSPKYPYEYLRDAEHLEEKIKKIEGMLNNRA
ncbi:MAG: coproporphyrinogen dehydrogenase HemZ, partial [Clostridia bacterium]|nr:coproporphyrinogen dehydrogenase HemZ [Clostridia bacterium]